MKLKTHLWCACIVGLTSIPLQAQTKLTFTYDAAGNQTSRRFSSSAKQLSSTENDSISDITAVGLNEDQLLESFSNALTIYPNPTKGKLLLEWLPDFSDSITKITVTDSGAQQSFTVPLIKGEHSVEVDLTPFASGLYLVHFVLDNRKIIVKKIIKN